jgi:hypothetical protein
VNVNDLLTLAKRRLQKAVFDYVDGGTEDEVALRQNCGSIQTNDVPTKASCLSWGLSSDLQSNCPGPSTAIEHARQRVIALTASVT